VPMATPNDSDQTIASENDGLDSADVTRDYAGEAIAQQIVDL